MARVREHKLHGATSVRAHPFSEPQFPYLKKVKWGSWSRYILKQFPNTRWRISFKCCYPSGGHQHLNNFVNIGGKKEYSWPSDHAHIRGHFPLQRDVGKAV